jgi:hypothetical protein
MANNYLLLVGQLCNDGYAVTFKIDGVTIINSQGEAILKSQYDICVGLWRINLLSEAPTPQLAQANNMYQLRNTVELFNYLHKDCFSPTKSDLPKAIKIGHFMMW